MDIKRYTILIANHTDPNHIDGCEYCPSGNSVKLRFNTGWIIIYRLIGSKIRFINFYKHTLNMD